ncbi:MAG TPA: hypothetical protein VHI93_06100 [Candidatus Thermoplasmatota archaeon]|nr:hypothetical protein [Candidatus Thermoplasmatota archaeon]
MRLTAVSAAGLALLLAGCVSVPPRDAAAQDALAACRAAPASEHVLYFGPGKRLVDALPAAGSAPGNGFGSAFLTDELKGWLSEPVDAGLWLVGNVTLSFWARSTGLPAPVVSPTTGEGYRFFNQFGSDQSLQPAYATEYGPPYEPAGTVTHYEERLEMPAGGFVVEKGQRVRVLLTDLAIEGQGGGGHDILFGGDTPSQVRFTARCFPQFVWSGATIAHQEILLPGNQGAVSQAAAREGVNRVRVEVPLPSDTSRLTIRLQQGSDANPVKDDIDLTLLDANGEAVWQIGSPYANERGTLWQDNLELFHGHVTVQVDSYSGVAYQGRLTVVAEAARLPPPA